MPNAQTIATETTVTSGGVPVDVVEQQTADAAGTATYTQALMLRDPRGGLITPLTENTGREILAELRAIREWLEGRD